MDRRDNRDKRDVRDERDIFAVPFVPLSQGIYNSKDLTSIKKSKIYFSATTYPAKRRSTMRRRGWVNQEVREPRLRRKQYRF